MLNQIKKTELMPASSTASRGNYAALKRHGFTLIEMMVVLILISILTGLSFVALRGAQLDTFYAKTRATIRKIDVIITDRYEEYRNANLSYTIYESVSGYSSKTLPRANAVFGASEPDAVLHARIRLELTRDMMRLDMPDCPGDILFQTGTNFFFRSSNQALPTGYTLNSRPMFVSLDSPAANGQIQTMLFNRAGNGNVGGVPRIRPEVLEQNFNAELLFLIVESSYIAGSYGIEAFATSEIGDTDNDGLREFIDAWGNPIQWLRAPTGYFDDIETSQTSTLQGSSSASKAVVSRYDPDPFSGYLTSATSFASDDFDPTSSDLGYVISTDIIDHPTSPIRPLIVSPGPDGQTGLRFFWSGNNAQTSGTVTTRMFSTADAVWKNAVSFGGSAATVAWPDPYHPRRPSIGNNGALVQVNGENANQCLGGVLNVEVDGNGSGPFDIPTGINGTTFIFGNGSLNGSVGAINAQIRDLVSDNVANFDEVGGSL